MALEPAEEKRFLTIIDGILDRCDITTVTTKQIRVQLQGEVQYDISGQKSQINELIKQRFDAFNARTTTSQPAVTSNSHVTGGASPHSTNGGVTNGVVKSIETSVAVAVAPPAPKPKSSSPAQKRTADESDLSSLEDEPKPKKKKVKQASIVDDDAAFAARLQDEENRLARPTRGGATRKRAPVAKGGTKTKNKKKSAARVKDDDDSSKESGSDEPKERKGAFHKPYNLSQPLAELLGETQLSRPQTVKKIWEYVRARDLQDPSDKRQIRCDEALRKVFKSERVHMFTMNKILSQQLYAVDE